MEARIKEVFQRFDRSGDGTFDMGELQKVFKTLGPSFTPEQISTFCRELDSGGDGTVSRSEFLEWIKGGSDASKLVAAAVKRETGEARNARIKETFQAYDKSGDGSLDVEELSRTLKSLGSFTIEEVRKITADLDKSKDGEVSFQEFSDWIKSGSGSKEILKAKAILAPSDGDGLEAVYYNFCGMGRSEMDGKSFLKLLKNASMLDEVLNETSVDMLFNDTKLKPTGAKFISFTQFEAALGFVAQKKGTTVDEVRMAVLEAGRPTFQGTKATAVQFHSDARLAKTGSSGLSQSLGSRPKPLAPWQRALNRPVDFSRTVDNTELWKVFGLNTEAGRSLKRIYSLPKISKSNLSDCNLSPSGRARPGTVSGAGPASSGGSPPGNRSLAATQPIGSGRTPRTQLPAIAGTSRPG